MTYTSPRQPGFSISPKRKTNLDLWAEYDRALRGRKLHFKWVKAHNGNKYNELVDELARQEAKTAFKTI